MRLRLVNWWREEQSSRWFCPALITIAAVVLANITTHLDGVLPPGQVGMNAWFFGSGPDGARGFLSAIAGTMAPMTALVFSISMAARQIASSQRSPPARGSCRATSSGSSPTPGSFRGWCKARTNGRPGVCRPFRSLTHAISAEERETIETGAAWIKQERRAPDQAAAGAG